MDDNEKYGAVNAQEVIYSESTSPEEELDEILKHDLWLDAETCKVWTN